ncbi:MAG: hypothetical protein WCR73_05515, partial [Acholeplasmataceae bacterium]
MPVIFKNIEYSYWLYLTVLILLIFNRFKEVEKELKPESLTKIKQKSFKSTTIALIILLISNIIWSNFLENNFDFIDIGSGIPSMLMIITFALVQMVIIYNLIFMLIAKICLKENKIFAFIYFPISEILTICILVLSYSSMLFGYYFLPKILLLLLLIAIGSTYYFLIYLLTRIRF